MSAFEVNRDHIDYLLSAAIAYNIPYGTVSWKGERVTITNADEVGTALLNMNVASVNERYDEGEFEGRWSPGEYRFRRWPAVSPVQVLKGIHCYQYQSCEHPGWKESEAYRFCKALERAAIQHLDGYEEADWEIARDRDPGPLRTKTAMLVSEKYRHLFSDN